MVISKEMTVMNKAMAEAFKEYTERSEIARACSDGALGAARFIVFDKARQKGELAFFELMGVKCRPLHPADSIKLKGKISYLRPTSKEEATTVSEKVLRAFREYAPRFPN